MKKTRGEREGDARLQQIQSMLLRIRAVRSSHTLHRSDQSSEKTANTSTLPISKPLSGEQWQATRKLLRDWWFENAAKEIPNLMATGLSRSDAADWLGATLFATIFKSQPIKKLGYRYKSVKDWEKFRQEVILFQDIIPALREQERRIRRENKKFAQWEKSARHNARIGDDLGIYRAIAKALYKSDDKKTVERLRKKVERLRKHGYLLD